MFAAMLLLRTVCYEAFHKGWRVRMKENISSFNYRMVPLKGYRKKKLAYEIGLRRRTGK